MVAGRGNPHLRHRADRHRQVQPRGLVQQVHAVEREPQRADRLQERIAGGILRGLPLVAAERDQDFVDVAGGGAVVVPERDGLGGVPEHRRQHLDAADRGRDVLRVGHGAGDVDVIERIAEPGGGRHVRDGGIPPLASDGVHPGGLAGDGVEVALSEAEGGRFRQVAAVDRELLAGLPHAAHDQFLRQASPLRAAVHRRPGGFQAVQHVRVRHADAHARQQGHRGAVNTLNLLIVQHAAEHAASFRSQSPATRWPGIKDRILTLDVGPVNTTGDPAAARGSVSALHCAAKSIWRPTPTAA